MIKFIIDLNRCIYYVKLQYWIFGGVFYGF